MKGEEDYRPLFENFVYDLLSTVNKPEWPAAELLLSLLGRLLVSTVPASSFHVLRIQDGSGGEHYVSRRVGLTDTPTDNSTVPFRCNNSVQSLWTCR